ncbi:MAG: NlpC/P60 family protein [Pseudomonadota bacterium]
MSDAADDAAQKPPPVPKPEAGKLDRRLNAFRADLADARLQGKVQADRFVAPQAACIGRDPAPLHRTPDAASPRESELLIGDVVDVFDVAGDWAWVQNTRDAYVGYVPAGLLLPPPAQPTHRVRAPATFRYAEPNMKSRVLGVLHLNAVATFGEVSGDFIAIADGGFVFARHLAEVAKPARDFVAVAEQFLDVPYLWGGNTRLGVDCSGLVQMALVAAGMRDCPRDSDMQFERLGEIAVAADEVQAALDADDARDVEGLQRGDLVFWTGHVGIMVDGVMMLHANAHHMMTVIEPFSPAAKRIAKAGETFLGARRLPATVAASG